MFVEVKGKKTGRGGRLFAPILSRVKHDNCIVSLSLTPTSPIVLTTFDAAISVTKLTSRTA